MAPKKVIAISSEADGGLSQTIAKITDTRKALLEEYGKKHSCPWVVAYSGGKDSTLLLHLVFDMILQLSPAERKRDVHVVGNDTLVESPLVIEHLHHSMKEVKKAAEKYNLPIRTMVTSPDIDQTYWVNVIGRGYAPPSRMFRWCTDRMKIQPTNGYILRRVSEHGRVILLIGARKSESTNRKRTMDKYYRKGSRLSKHPSLAKCSMFSPLADLTTEEVWMTLLQMRPPWGGTYRKLITLYRNARGGGGECPLVLSKEDAPSCGTTSPRFGCWTCTVVEKDRSMSGLVDSGFEEFEPMLEFRDWLQSIRGDVSRRMRTRRNGTVIYKNGKVMYGPFTLDTRREILHKLDGVEERMKRPLISRDERDYIDYIWKEDAVLDKIRSRSYLGQGANRYA